jgi:hypothetical protein
MNPCPINDSTRHPNLQRRKQRRKKVHRLQNHLGRRYLKKVFSDHFINLAKILKFIHASVMLT